MQWANVVLGDGQIEFDMFIQSMVTVKTLTDVFKGYDITLKLLMVVWTQIGMGSLQLGLNNFLRLSFVNVSAVRHFICVELIWVAWIWNNLLVWMEDESCSMSIFNDECRYQTTLT